MNYWNNCKTLEQFIHTLSSKSLISANEIIEDMSSIKDFFKSDSKLDEFIKFTCERYHTSGTFTTNDKSWGDVQTPQWFVKEIYKIISQLDFTPDVILEPTFGDGNFLLTSLDYFPKDKFLYGIEIQEKHIWNFLLNIIERIILEKKKLPIQLKIYHDNFFTHDFSKELLNNQELKILIIGNPPWITSSELSVLQSNNLPIKSNIKGFTGLDAITGKSNFDITEFIITNLITTFSNHMCKIALLCKESVIRNILKELIEYKYPLNNIRAIKFDAVKVFNKNCEAALFLADINKEANSQICLVSNFDNPFKTINKFGWVNGKFVSNIDNYILNQEIDGQSSVIWRQGIKHDCAEVLELDQKEDGCLENRLGEKIVLENQLLYPLLKGSDLRDFEIKKVTRRLLLTQKTLNEKVEDFTDLYPKTWEYLNNHLIYFQKRKSKVYQSKNNFAIFGVGEYSFKNYKVAIAGFYKEVKFIFVPPIDNKPVVFDDTCYYIGFDSYIDAIIYCSALNSRKNYEFLDTIAFKNSKRPFTKEILMRIDTKKIISYLTFENIQDFWSQFNYNAKFDLDKDKILKRKMEILLN
ncbi:MAG: methyltransferase [Candidatus Heimdallarchaeota archaeon]|nr:methyltransferase [Candidatus Heimdallarchaeota archaeon]